MAFNLADALAAAGVNLDTGRPMEIERVSIDLIVPDEKNFYELSELEALAASIATVGLQQPLLVRPMPGDESQVIITSGHRRHAALKMLIEQDGREDLRDVPCIIAPADENPHLTQLKLIMANSTARKLSSADQAKQAEQIEELLYQLKEEGMEFPGRMRDHVAEACKVSTGKLARLKTIRSGLIPQFMRRWEAGNMPDNLAELLAKETPKYQKTIWLEQTKNMTAPFQCNFDWTSKLLRTMHRIEDNCKNTTCLKNYTTSCDHVHFRLNKAAGLAQYDNLVCGGCCCTCPFLLSCKYPCEHAAEEKAAKKEQARKDRALVKEENSRVEKPRLDLISTAYARVGAMLKEKGIEEKDYIKSSKEYVMSGDMDRLHQLEAGVKAKLTDRMPGGIWADDALRLIRTADLLGCSVDYLLGREIPKEKPAQQPAGWSTGTPSDRGNYVVAYRRQPGGPMFYRAAFWTGKKWEQLDSMIDVLSWMKAPEVE